MVISCQLVVNESPAFLVSEHVFHLQWHHIRTAQHWTSAEQNVLCHICQPYIIKLTSVWIRNLFQTLKVKFTLKIMMDVILSSSLPNI